MRRPRLRPTFAPGGARAARMGLPLLLALAVPASPLAAEDTAATAGRIEGWNAGSYSFSDELGGFRITGAAGVGTEDDPITVTQELDSASPVTMVIRAIGPLRPFGMPGQSANGFLHLRIRVRNASGLAWIEFGFELQEIRDQPSVFGDGLSFDQRKSESDDVSSSTFSAFSRDFEPYDRLTFRQGKVDPGETAGFGFLVTDFTPRTTFFLVLDPRIPSS